MTSSDSIIWRRDIRNTITANLKISKFEKNEEKFMPHGLLEKILENGKFSIEETLGLTSSNASEDQDLLQFVKISPKLFGIVALCQRDECTRKRAMQLFKRNHYDDTRLPLPEPQGSDRKSVLATFEEDLNDKHDPIWEDGDVEEFFRAQRMFLAPRFDVRKDNEDFDRRIILPFVDKDVMPNKGTFGVLYKMKIHSSHIVGVADGEAFNPVVAVKHIIPKDKTEHQKIITKWFKEADALRSMNKLGNPHIVRFITAFRQIGSPDNDTHLYLMFEWADGGNLRQLWRSSDMVERCGSLTRAVVQQIKGLASALNDAHNPPEGLQYRHGDLKPENVLWFRGNGGLGTLKIGDWGEAKGHNVKTEFRPNNTTAGFGTRRYEAPEVVTGLRTGRTGGALNRRSRLYDVWAMGCITLEFLVWLVYGPSGLEIFNDSITGDPDTFYQIKQTGVEKVARVHDVVVQWMDDMAQDSSCKVGVTALGNLLEIVRRDLLVVEVDYSVATGLPASRPLTPKLAAQSTGNLGVPGPKSTHTLPTSHLTVPNSSGPVTKVSRVTQGLGSKPVRGKGRVRSDYFHHRMEEMATGYEDDDYWSIGSAFRQIPAELAQLAGSRKLSAYRTEYQNTGMSTSDITDPKSIDYGKLRLDRDWAFNFDNGTASRIFQAVRKFGAAPLNPAPNTAQLCDECSQLRDHIWRPNFRKLYYRDELRSVALSGTCQLHSLLWRTCELNRGAENDTVSFENVSSALRLDGGGDPVLNIVKDHGTVLGMGEEVQISFPELLPAGSHGHLEIVRQWLNHCNEKHINYGCRGSKYRSTASGTDRPTRLIYVGEPGDNRVHLYQSKPSDTEPWIALSHQWGTDRSKHFSTTSSNVDDFMKELKIEDLPKTFSDAVKVTRELGCKYLWIDSLCIIQSGPRMDFDREAKRMEMVYSGAYCVLAASCASGHHSGFLQRRNPRQYLRMSTGVGNDAKYSICQTIDRFNDHVLEGALNKRGWVLQEHALARRTIFFTEHQTYFECGGGVKCETMTQMNNNLAALLGDPNFPAILSVAKQGERILRFQTLYEQYSRLGLSKEWDRPTAIDGLEQRLLSAMQLKGGFGVFDGGETGRGLLRRSLLWCRGDDEASLQRIESLKGKIPSWSWMAYTGGITYLSPDFNMYDWNDVVSPWADGARGDRALVAMARRFEIRDRSEAEAKFKMDAGEGSQPFPGLCIVLGRYKGDMSVDEKTHYVLLIAPKDNSAPDSVVYERIGAGYLPGADIKHDEGEVTIV